jgi:hypothetical protein
MRRDTDSPRHLSISPDDRRRGVGGYTWLASFAIATIFGLMFALQRWAAYRGPDKPASFWDARFIQPQLIPWYAWAAIAPILMLVLDRLPWNELRSWRRAGLYVALAVVAIVVQATLAGFALGWWWAFPSPIPMDPTWHIAFELRNRTTMSLLIVWLITAMYHATVRASGGAHVEPAATPIPPLETRVEPPATMTPVNGPIPLRTADRIWFVDPHSIEWIEADGDYVIVHVGTVNHRVRETISSIERRIPANQLIRVSRSAIVNLAAIREMQRWFRGNFVIILRDGTKVTTGARYRDRIVRRT